ncbi:MAG: DUF4011 domain-containing protein, partial [Deltaproteobacteria bacterium]|nr:DUF4011 domain-containing protein [Deltaproteobacteria bacterium]
MTSSPDVVEPVRLEVTLAPRVNLAFHQNAVPFVADLAVVNESEQRLDDVTVELACEPEFMRPKRWRIDSVGPAERYRVPSLSVELDAGMLARLTEAEHASVRIISLVDGIELARSHRDVELLPRNHWSGIGHMPEMVAAFVQPNDPAIDRILKSASEILRANGRDAAITGYEGGARRTWEVASAIWTAIGSLGLDYALPPASFEYAGQKVRSASQLVDARVATCLDTTLLFCACLEQCQLHPIIVFTRGHAFAGVWLRREGFSLSVVDDPAALRKRLQLNELVLVETTLLTQRPLPAFSRAVEQGADRLRSDDDAFEMAVDVLAARRDRIKPLASGLVLLEPEPVPHDLSEPMFEPAPDLPDEFEPEAVEQPKTPEGRLDRWQRKLLDLSLRNSMLNFRATVRVIPLDTPDPGALEDLLADSQRIKLQPRPDLMRGVDPRNANLFKEKYDEDARRGHALDALQRREVLVGLGTSELERRLVEIYRQARGNMQEGGANTLFLAFGFLLWKREKDERTYKAPLVLIPVTLERKSVRSGFTLMLHEDEPRFNPTLLEMLRQDFGLVLPYLDQEMPKDDHGLDIDGIWREVARAIKDIPGWEVLQEVALATFSFAKFLMWKDLVDRTDDLKNSPVVRHLLETPRDPYGESSDFVDPRRLDRDHAPEQTFCPLPADSSQLSAVLAAARGKDFVLIGPPGTGKSQTIANLIAQCLAEQKTVLFVSEKTAALDVVYRRLREVGLGEFCLELHSNKARKLDVLDQFRQAWEARGEVDEAEWRREAAALQKLRGELNDYVEHLHQKHRNGLSVFDAIARLAAADGEQQVRLSWPVPDVHDADNYRGLCGLADRLAINAGALGDLVHSPLALVATTEWSPSWQDALVEAAGHAPSVVEALESAYEALCATTGVPAVVLTKRSLDGLARLAECLPDAAGSDWRFVLRPDARLVCSQLRDGMKLVAEHRELHDNLPQSWPVALRKDLEATIELVALHAEASGQLSTAYEEEFRALDLRALKAEWDAAQATWFLPKFFGTRRVTKQLRAFVPEGSQPDIGSDLETLLGMVDLEIKLDALAPSIATQGFERGDTAEIAAALRFQRSLDAARSLQAWADEGLDLVEEGRCGAEMQATLQVIRRMRKLRQDLDALRPLAGRTDDTWADLQTDLERVAAAIQYHSDVTSALARAAATTEELQGMHRALDLVLGDGNSLLEPGGAVATACRRFCDAGTAYTEARERVRACCGQSAAEFEAVVHEEPSRLARRCREIVPLEAKLRGWCAWRKAKVQATSVGLGALVAGVETGAVAVGTVLRTFERSYAAWWLRAVVDRDPVLRGFVAAEHENRIETFKKVDDRFNELTRRMVRARLYSELPTQAGVSRSSGWGLLKREIQKKRAHLALRVLIEGISDALPKLTPCLLMSPLSIAQYLPTGQPKFDLVVFDEASQIPVWDAVGAIARGQRVVMVGDPKQLPPTNFFERAEEDADEDITIESDMESILDECIAANLVTRTLDWHYRSRHESLIAFSNHRYYEGRLVTFPAPVTDDRAVRFHYVADGIYEKGGGRINKPEAKALVADIVARLRDPCFVESGRTIGVVTFNSQQQKLIEDLLDEERRADPSIEQHFSEDRLEPVFVKNLENVQGDERDVMYFSITFGPDITGAISMNFGAMNRPGGHRRLNVAVTRSRCELLVYSSFTSEKIDLSRTKADGMRDLKHFLDFAERGPCALAEAFAGS